MALTEWESHLSKETLALWTEAIFDLGPEAEKEPGEPPAKKRHALYTEAGDGSGGHHASALPPAHRGPGAAPTAAGAMDTEPDGAPALLLSSVLATLRARSRQLTYRYMSSVTEEQTAPRLLAMLEMHALVLRLHALNFEGVDAALELKLHARLWESAVRRLGSDQEAAPRYFVLLVDIATSLFALPVCAQFVSPIKAFLVSVASLPWLCGEDSYAAASSDALQPLNSVTNVDSLQAIWTSRLLPHLSVEDVSSCIYLMTLVPIHSNINVPHRMLLSLCQNNEPTLRAAAIRALPYFLATCRRYPRNNKVDFGEFRAPLQPVMASSSLPDEVRVKAPVY